MHYFVLFVVTVALVFNHKCLTKRYIVFHVGITAAVILLVWQASHGWVGVYNLQFKELLGNCGYSCVFGTSFGLTTREHFAPWIK